MFLAVTNTLAYCPNVKITAEKVFVNCQKWESLPVKTPRLSCQYYTRLYVSDGVRRTFVEADIYRSGHSSKRTFVEADIRQSGHLSKRTFVEADIHQSGHSLKRTFVEADIRQSGHSYTANKLVY
jgi:hypothetical protein